MEAVADLAAFGRFAKRLEKQDATALRKRIRTAVNEVGKDTLAEIKASASWSTGATSRAAKRAGAKGDLHKSIPAATRLRTSFAARSSGVTVVTNARMAPHARPLEGGSGGARRGVNRHPVFGQRVYVNQPTRPFFFDNAAKGRKDLPVKLQQQLNEIAKELGF